MLSSAALAIASALLISIPGCVFGRSFDWSGYTNMKDSINETGRVLVTKNIDVINASIHHFPLSFSEFALSMASNFESPWTNLYIGEQLRSFVIDFQIGGFRESFYNTTIKSKFANISRRLAMVVKNDLYIRDMNDSRRSLYHSWQIFCSKYDASKHVSALDLTGMVQLASVYSPNGPGKISDDSSGNSSNRPIMGLNARDERSRRFIDGAIFFVGIITFAIIVIGRDD
jgi:hypothetical protein